MKKLILISSLFLASMTMFAQGFNNETSGFSISIEKVATGQVENIVDTLYMEHCVIEMVDASQINKVLFVLKDEHQNQNLYGEQILMDGSSTLPAEMAFQVNANEARVIVGPYAPTRALKYTILLEDSNGNISEPQTIP